jgi:pathogenesis-related protein 1
MVDLVRARVDPLSMQTRWGLLVIAIAACSGSDDPANSDGGTDGMSNVDAQGGVGEPADLMGITLYHNQVRALVQTATPLPALQWDPSLAANAAAWAAMCKNDDGSPAIMDHSTSQFRSMGQPYYVGENIFASSGNATAMGAVNSWASEKSNYNYDSNTCNGTCGHYTQIVWRATLKLGCAKQNCPNIQFPSTILCNYGPGGNNGGKPY